MNHAAPAPSSAKMKMLSQHRGLSGESGKAKSIASGLLNDGDATEKGTCMPTMLERKAPEKSKKITRFSLWDFSRTVVVVKFTKEWLEFVWLKMFKKVRNL